MFKIDKANADKQDQDEDTMEAILNDSLNNHDFDIIEHVTEIAKKKYINEFEAALNKEYEDAIMQS